MNIKNSLTFILCLITTQSVAQTLVEDTNIELLGSSPNYHAIIYQDAEANDFTGILFSIDAGPEPGYATLTFDAIKLDEGSDWYLVELNDIFSETSITNGTHPIWGGVGPGGIPITGGTIDVPIGDFYLGVNTDACFCWPGTRDIFGWAQFNVDSSLNLQLVDNAVAYETSQIIVGQNSIPEPSSFVVLCALFLATRIRRATSNVAT